MWVDNFGLFSSTVKCSMTLSFSPKIGKHLKLLHKKFCFLSKQLKARTDIISLSKFDLFENAGVDANILWVLCKILFKDVEKARKIISFAL